MRYRKCKWCHKETRTTSGFCSRSCKCKFEKGLEEADERANEWHRKHVEYDPLTKLNRELDKQGMSYGEWQAQKTLRMIGRIQI